MLTGPGAGASFGLMNGFDPLLDLGVALALGLLIGLERGWHDRDAGEGGRVAGLRTYGLVGLLGGFAALLSDGPVFLGFAFVGVVGAFVVAYGLSGRHRSDVGITSLVAALLTFIFGAAVVQGFMAPAAIGAVITAFLLQYKAFLHRWIDALSPGELHAALKLLLISVVLLPVLPDTGYGPWDALNPFRIWWMVVLIAGISFVGYFAMRIAGTGKGAVLTGLAAGLASSTALTLHFSRLARESPDSSRILGAGILLACGTMFPRMLLLASVIDTGLFMALVAPAAVMGVVVYGSAALLWWRRPSAEAGEQAAKLRNPLALGSALVFGALLAVIMMAAEGLKAVFGDAGILALSAVSGITDVDAITLTLADMSGADLAAGMAALGIVVAGAVNSVVKGAMTLAIGGPRLGLHAAGPLALAAATGLVVAWLA